MKNLITYLKTLWRRGLDSQRKEVGVISGEATIEQPLSTYSAPLGTCWQPSGKLHSVVRCAAMLVMLFTIGIGNVWGDNYEIMDPSTESLTGGEEYLIAIHDRKAGKYYFIQSGSTKHLEQTVSAGVVSNPAAATVWIATANSTNWQFRKKGAASNGYLYNSGSNTTLSTNNGTAATWYVSNGSSGSPAYKYFKMQQGGSSSGRYISWSGSTFAAYANSNWGSKGVQPANANLVQYNGALQIFKKAAACSSEITITKGSDPANGTFTINNSGTVCIDDGNASTTVTATPSSHYHLATVTSTGGGTVGAISNNTCTVSNISANTTINVTFAADPTYTVTWVAGSNPSFSTQTNYAGTALTDPGTPSAASYCPGGKVFVGWTETPIVGEGSAPADLFTSVTGKSIPSGGTTYYAVFADASSGSVSKTYELTIERADVPSSYADTWSAKDAAEIGGGAGTLSVSLSGTNVMQSTASGHTTHIQFKASSTGFYNTTDLGTINSITTNNSDIKYYINSSSNPSSSGSGGYFRVYNSTSGARYTASIVINFTKTVSGTTYSNYATTCCTPLASINGSFSLPHT